ncbi:hypothetical protein [Nostoc sp.]|uniref:hypothetical protein n=1 Tax=Nostoc sp. TaxID=1180 RepID=UPI002FF6C6FB
MRQCLAQIERVKETAAIAPTHLRFFITAIISLSSPPSIRLFQTGGDIVIASTSTNPVVITSTQQ